MKIFWAILLAVFVAAGILLFRQSGHSNGAPAPITAPPPAPASTADAPVEPAATPAPKPAEPAPQKAPEPAPTAAPRGETRPPAKPIDSIDDLNSLLNLPPAEKTETKTDVALPKPAPQAPPTAPGPTPTPTASTAVAHESKPAGAPAPAGAAPTGVAGRFTEIVPVRKAPGEDGWTTLDERFQIKGAGTAEDPYEVSWDLLVSASETYQPRMGKLRMPERIAMLDGKFVRITGYVAFPIMAMEQNEMLSMRNMWDGCCIGTPPTPYDAIEVKLKKAATGKDRFASYGSVLGKFSVDPYVKGNWLLGLYLMNDAELGPGKQGGL